MLGPGARVNPLVSAGSSHRCIVSAHPLRLSLVLLACWRAPQIRAQIAGEMRDDMKCVLEDNTDLVRRFARSSLENCLKISAAPEARPPLAGAVAAENN